MQKQVREPKRWRRELKRGVAICNRAPDGTVTVGMQWYAGGVSVLELQGSEVGSIAILLEKARWYRDSR